MTTKRLHFLKQFDYVHKSRAITSYAAGSTVPVPAKQAERALALDGVAEEVTGNEPNDGDTVQSLVDGNTRDQLVELAGTEGVEAEGTKQQIAERIIAKRTA